MKKVAVITDSNSGITQEEAKKMGVFVLSMPFMIDEVEYFEDINLNAEGFFDMLEEDKKVSTSQPSLAAVTELWDKVLEEYESIVHIPMSSSLSSTYQTAVMLSDDYDGRISVVDNQRISVTLRQSVKDALVLAGKGKTASEIKEILEANKSESSIYIMVDTLTYLKKGGRITPAAAALGTLLKLKPVLQIQGGKLDAFAKARTIKQAKGIMLNAVKSDLEGRFKDYLIEDMVIDIAHSRNHEAANEFKKEVLNMFPHCKEEDINVCELPLSIACHIGPGALAITCSKKEK